MYRLFPRTFCSCISATRVLRLPLERQQVWPHLGQTLIVAAYRHGRSSAAASED